MKEDWIYRRGDIYKAVLDNRTGFIQNGTRPVIVLQNNYGNFYAPTLIVAPLSSKTNKKQYLPTHYLVETKGLVVPSMVLLEQITTIDKRQIKEYVGTVSDVQMEKINACIEKSLGLYIPGEIEAP